MKKKQIPNIMGFILIISLAVSCSSLTIETIETKWDQLAAEQTAQGRRIVTADLESDLDKKLENDPTNLYYLRMRVRVSLFAGNREGALSDLKAILDINSDYLEYYWQRSRITGSKTDLMNMIEIDPHNVKAYYQLGFSTQFKDEIRSFNYHTIGSRKDVAKMLETKPQNQNVKVVISTHSKDEIDAINSINYYTKALDEIKNQKNKFWQVPEGKIYFERALVKDSINDHNGACLDIIKGAAYEDYYKHIYPNNCGIGPIIHLWPYGWYDDNFQNSSLSEKESMKTLLLEQDKLIALIDADPKLNINHPRVASIYWKRASQRLWFGDYKGMLHDVNMLMDRENDYILKRVSGSDVDGPDIALKAFRGFAKSKLGDIKGAISDYSNAIRDCDGSEVIGNFSTDVAYLTDSDRCTSFCEGMEEILAERALLYLQSGMMKSACFDVSILDTCDEINHRYEPRLKSVTTNCQSMN